MAIGLMNRQLKETGLLTGACWAVWLERGAAEWFVLAAYKLPRAKQTLLMRYLEQPATASWLAGALTARHNRSRRLPESTGLNCGRLYLFPEPTSRRVIAVGADNLSERALKIWRLVALGGGWPSSAPAAGAGEALEWMSSIPYDLPKAFDRALRGVLREIPCQGGWLAIRSGDFLEVRAQVGCPEGLGNRISLDANPLLRSISQKRSGVMVLAETSDWAMVPRMGFRSNTQAWACVPLTVGQRVIGMIALWREQPLAKSERQQLDRLAIRMAPLVEASEMFTSLTDHLRRLALLNDFALTVSSALDLDQIAQRVFGLLRRALGPEWITLALLSTDGNTLHYYFDQDGRAVAHSRPAEEDSLLRFVHLGDIYRLDDLEAVSAYTPLHKGTRSVLLVPIKYRRQVIGLLGLESSRPAAFKVFDEHLLVVVASYLAGLVENGRLRQEAEGRARNLELIHDVVQQVVGLTDVEKIAQIAAELMARNFAYELAVVGLADEENLFRVVGIGGSAAKAVQRGLRGLDSAASGGITYRVFVTGESMLVNDVALDPFYLPIPGWEAGSEMCVALREGDRILGIIDVESRQKNNFSHNDLLVLEALAGILANVIAHAGQYQKLQSAVHQLQAAREELQERMTAQRVAETRLIQAAKLAAVGEMAAGIAHELNNPLTTIAGFAELVLADLPSDDPMRPDLELVLREAHRARSVIRRLLDFSRQSESVRVRADINEIVSDVLALMNHLLHTSGVEVHIELGEQLPWISVDRNQIKQVLLNLLHNALHAMPGGGRLTVQTMSRQRDGDRWLVISIQDNGVGISPENMSRIFEPFFTTRARQGGTGLGLSVSYGIVTDHGGFIEVESREGQGSTFSVWLPVEVEQ
ncbi:MAG: GAF domain-containing protein [Anaerolineales bacterium]